MSEPDVFQRATNSHQQGQAVEARALYEEILAGNPSHFKSLYRVAALYLQSGDAQTALQRIDRALAITPDHATCHGLRGNALEALGRLEEAVAAFDQAIRFDPNPVPVLSNKAVVLTALRRYREAIAICDHLITAGGDVARAYRIRATALLGEGRREDALGDIDAAIALRPDHGAAHRDRGEILAALKRYADAAESFERALQMSPGLAFVLGHVMAARQQICDWRDYARRVADLLQRVDTQQLATEPGILLSLPASAAQLQRSASVYFRHITKGLASSPAPARPTARDKIRVGYFSADFSDHVVMVAIAGLLEKHDRTQFEISAFSLSRGPDDSMQARLRNAFDRFIDVSTMPDEAVANLARDMNIDVAVDLMGYTAHCRPGIFARRAAPVQVAYLGYPGTMAAPCIDYILADQVVIPAEQRPYYTEKICYLPPSYQANAPKVISNRTFTRRELGLPEDAFVFCSFNSVYKFTPDLYDSWMRILDRVKDSVLWLSAANPAAVKNLRAAVRDRGVSPDRIVFADFLPELADHLARLRTADLFLDTFYFGAHTTASDALWAGLPVLTKLGETFAGRVAASLLTAAGVPELITRSAADYEDRATDLAANPERLAQLKRRLDANRLSSPLFDATRFARNIEAAFRNMIALHDAGRAPEDLTIVEAVTGSTGAPFPPGTEVP